MNNKGFAVSGILYTILLIFLALLMMLLFNFEGKKNILDNIKGEIFDDLNIVKYNNGQPIFFNPETGNVCSIEAYNANTNASKTGNKTGCMKWYAFNDSNEAATVNMILDHNTTALVRWSTTSSNNTNGDAVKAQLVTDTTSWKSNLNPRLITADEVAEITGNTTFSGATSTTSSWFYFDTNTNLASEACKSGNITECQYGWLYDRTSTNCTIYGCLNNADSGMTGVGYWTSTPVSGNTLNAWYVNCNGLLSNYDVNRGSEYGVRPVITVSKKVLTGKVCDLSINKEYTFDYTGSEQEFTVPCVGNYKLETWGAQGGSYSSTTYGGYGAYSTGEIKLNQNEKYYINIGGNVSCVYAGSGGAAETAGGYNGGGRSTSCTLVTTAGNYSCGGGGATHISSKSGLLSSLEEYKGIYNQTSGTYDSTEILLVSGGGGGSIYLWDGNISSIGGSAGGKVGSKFIPQDATYYKNVKSYVLPSQKDISIINWDKDYYASFGQGQGECSGGGSGWYGGAGYEYTLGGSSYIGNTSLTNKAMYCYNCTESSDVATKTISTTNVSATPTSNYAKQGNGYAKITYLGN